MLVSMNWLKQYVNLGQETPESLAEKVTKAGIEVDEITYITEGVEHVVTGYVKSCEKHPDADKLNVCQVDVGTETLQIVCGAPNIKAGQYVIVAKVGAVLPGDFKIKKARLRGQESNGMICSLQELGVKEQYVPKALTDGIFAFEEKVEIGKDAKDYLNLDDAILTFDLTPNRADALSMLGVAYEVAAILNEKVILPEEEIQTIESVVSDVIKVEVENTADTPYYGAFLAKDIQVKPSPLWMRNYLMASGIRPINNVVDITNFVLLEYGQPLHAFDFDKFGSKKVYVRRATSDEKFKTLDEQTRTLSPEHLVVTNGQEPTALAGVMGGFDSEVTDGTTTVLLEAAYFNGSVIRRAVKDHQLRSESSTRFEKGLDPNRVKKAAHRALHLLEKYADATIYQGVSEADVLDYTEKEIIISTDRINARLGTTLTDVDIKLILEKLQFNYLVEGEKIKVFAPTRRQDLVIFEDILEEVARIYGYDNLAYTLPEGGQHAGKLTERQALKRFVKRYLQGAGLSEIITYALTSETRVKTFMARDVKDKVKQPVSLQMPMSADRSTLRLSLLPEMLDVLGYNAARKETNQAVYEVGSVFISKESKLTEQPEENLRLSGAFLGEWLNHSWQQEKKAIDFYVVKGLVEGLFDRLKLKADFKQAEMEDMHPGRTAEIFLNGQSIGFIGQVHPTLAKAYGIKSPFVFDLNLDVVMDHVSAEPSFEKIARFPSMTRDIALVVDEGLPASEIEKTITEHAGPYLTNVTVFDLYQGEHLDQGKKSIAFSLRFQNPERTLTDEEVETSYASVLKAVQIAHLAELR